MQAVDRWIARHARAEQRRPLFDDALLTGRAWSYASYRVRYLLIRVILRACLHLAEVMLFSMVFSMEFLGPVILLRSGTAVAGSLWWGALEQMRGKIRDLAFERRFASIRKEIDTWLLLAVVVVVLMLGSGTTWVLLTPDERLGFSIFDTYALACLLRLAFDIVSRTYHSGMFALRRIYRPLWSLLVCDVLDIAGVLALWPFLGPWSFGIVLAGVGILRAVISLHYSRRAFSLSKIPPIGFRLLFRRFDLLPLEDLPAAFRHGLANAASQIDSVLIMALVAASAANDDYLGLAVLFYLVRPFMTAGFGWARLFYFDFKKLELKYSGFFRARFEHFLRRAALAFAAVMSAMALLWAAAVWGNGPDATMTLLPPFFVARSYCGLFEVQAFSYGRYRYLLAMTAILGAGILGVALLPFTSATVLLLMTALMALSIVLLGAPKSAPRPAASVGRATLVSLPRWLQDLTAEAGEVRIAAATIKARLGSATRIMRELVKVVPFGAVTRVGRNQILWFEDAACGVRTEAEIVLGSAGSLASLTAGNVEPNGAVALRQAVSSGLLGERLCALLEEPLDPGLLEDGLRAEFVRRFPAGVVLDRGSGWLPRRMAVSSFQVRRILGEVTRTSEGVARKRRGVQGLDLTIFCPGGEPSLLFFLENEYDADARASWRRLVEAVTLRRSCRGGAI